MNPSGSPAELDERLRDQAGVFGVVRNHAAMAQQARAVQVGKQPRLTPPGQPLAGQPDRIADSRSEQAADDGLLPRPCPRHLTLHRSSPRTSIRILPSMFFPVPSSPQPQ